MTTPCRIFLRKNPSQSHWVTSPCLTAVASIFHDHNEEINLTLVVIKLFSPFFSALVGSLAMVGLGIFSTLVAKVYNRIGPRATVIIGVIICSGALLATSQGNNIYLILLTYGVIFGFGSCFIFLPPYLVIPRYFVKRRSLAVGVVAMGVGGGLFVMSPIMTVLLDELGWRKTYMVLAGFVALSVPLICTIQRLPPEKTEDVAERNVKGRCCESIWTVFRNKRFDIIFISMNLYYVVHYIPSVHMVSSLTN